MGKSRSGVGVNGKTPRIKGNAAQQNASEQFAEENESCANKRRLSTESSDKRESSPPRRPKMKMEMGRGEKTVCKRRVVGVLARTQGKVQASVRSGRPGCLLYAWIRGYLPRGLPVMSHLTSEWRLCI
ncbi:hypothetical protein JTE90_011035 [Oedothorax gibbosus]|uniref:Uncharacterized protein n=1 Tax=Oedothorax gibbosus TaxID=931172 RepID=A0AAV6VCS4_9ARAC|nr:hypothetical protein JTE90_011035 [Oedothorax gibbosus]